MVDVMDIVERLIGLCTDWDNSAMVDGEPPLDDVRVRDLRNAAAEITRLRAVEERFSIMVDDYKALHKEAVALHARLDEAEKVIKPFAEKCVSCGHNLPRYDLQAQLTYDYRLKMNDIRAAAKWMEDK